jgi:hypothetical protein
MQRDMQIAAVKTEIRRYSSQYSARLSANPNGLVVNLMEPPDKRSAYRIPSVIVAFVMLVFKVYFVSLTPKSHKRL